MGVSVFFFQAEDGIRDLVRSRGLGDVYKRQVQSLWRDPRLVNVVFAGVGVEGEKTIRALPWSKRCKAGKVRLVRGEWNEEFIAEAALFPRGAFDDQIDSVSGGVRALGFDESEALVVGENPLYS